MEEMWKDRLVVKGTGKIRTKKLRQSKMEWNWQGERTNIRCYRHLIIVLLLCQFPSTFFVLVPLSLLSFPSVYLSVSFHSSSITTFFFCPLCFLLENILGSFFGSGRISASMLCSETSYATYGLLMYCSAAIWFLKDTSTTCGSVWKGHKFCILIYASISTLHFFLFRINLTK